MTTPLPSYTNGVWDAPMLGDTIGDNFDRTVAAHADRDALVDRPSGRRWTYAELRRDVDAVAVGLLKRGIGKGDRVGIWAPNCPEWTLIQFATAKIGAVLVNINPAYRAHELKYVLDQAGIRLLVSAPEFKFSDYAAMIEEVRPQCPDLEMVVLLGSAEWSRLASDGMAAQAADPSLLPAAQAALSSDDPINIQYTSGTTGFPQGRDAQPPQHPEQRILRRRAVPLHGERPRLHPGAVLPLLRHGDGQPGVHESRRDHGHSGALLRPESHAAGRRSGEVHVAVRGADDVHRRTRRTGLRIVRPVEPADRNHGRITLPGGGDEAGHRTDGDGRGLHLLRHDRDVAGVVADPVGRHDRSARVDGRPGRPAPRGQDRRSGNGVDRSAGHAG